jgi:hypothetical protein
MATEPASLFQDASRIAGTHPHRETEPADYAALNAVWAALLAGVVLATQDRGARRDPISGPELIPLSAAAFALSKVIARERIGTWVREPFVEETGSRRRPKGRRLRYALGELLTCTRCTGAWSALALAGLRLHAPATGRTVATVLATSAGQDFLHATFSYVCARADTRESEASSRTDAPRRAAAAGPRAA